MAGALQEKIAGINARVALLLEESRAALRGERGFGLEQVRALSQPIAEMAPVMARAGELTAQHPEIEGEIALYRKSLLELRTTLNQVHMMLIARRTGMVEARNHLDAVAKWAAATRLIR